MTEEEYIKQHQLTKRLKTLGVSDEQLAVVRIVADLDHPYPGDWIFIYASGGIQIDLSGVPRELVQAYGLLKWLGLGRQPDTLLASAAATVINAVSTPLLKQSMVARNPRPRAKQSHRTIVISKMKPAKNEGQSLPAFLQSASADSIEDIKVEALGPSFGNKWRITCHDLDAEKPPVSYRTLEDWWKDAS